MWFFGRTLDRKSQFHILNFDWSIKSQFFPVRSIFLYGNKVNFLVIITHFSACHPWVATAMQRSQKSAIGVSGDGALSVQGILQE